MNWGVTVWSLAAAEPEYIIVLGGELGGTSEPTARPVLRTVRTSVPRDDKVLLAWSLGSLVMNLFLCYQPSWMATAMGLIIAKTSEGTTILCFSLPAWFWRTNTWLDTRAESGAQAPRGNFNKGQHKMNELSTAESPEEETHSASDREKDRRGISRAAVAGDLTWWWPGGDPSL